ncbi:MAG TPA: DUF3052 family protein [Actinomycetota bacterium]|nr:DUF3052 family protein [Actinomycetota bacterium]
MAVQKKTDYSGTPLYRKLGIKEESAVLLAGAPPEFERTLGSLPAGAEIVADPAGSVDVVLLFVTQEEELERRFAELAGRVSPAGGLWVLWPKKSSKIPNDLSFEAVQKTGLHAGLVDNKSCSVDTDWQALRFVYRKKDRK